MLRSSKIPNSVKWWCKRTLIFVWCVVLLFSEKTLIASGHCATSSQYNFILGTKHSSHVSLHYTLENLTTLLLFSSSWFFWGGHFADVRNWLANHYKRAFWKVCPRFSLMQKQLLFRITKENYLIPLNWKVWQKVF